MNSSSEKRNGINPQLVVDLDLQKASIKKNLADIGTLTSLLSSMSMIRETGRQIAKFQNLLQQLNVESFDEKLCEMYQRDFYSFEKKYENLYTHFNKQLLLEKKTTNSQGKFAKQAFPRSSVPLQQSIVEDLENQNSALLNVQNIANETEIVGLSLTQNLLENREKIKSAHRKVKNSSGFTEIASTTVRKMQLRENRRMCLVVKALHNLKI
eukprot:snap_masked-scaffold_2-processed-gene-17.0-mRNA-1 protein AED:1.00 eAED:1.00 QI:0/0/0/0/1/1/2/0/210